MKRANIIFGKKAEAKQERAGKGRKSSRRKYLAYFDVLEERQLLSVTPVIHFLASQTSYPVGIAVNVDALTSNLNSSTPTTVAYQWNFGDTTSGSKYNVLPGFNAGHIFDTAGTYSVKLTITDSSGSYSATSNVTITSDTRQQIYVDNVSGSDSNSGADSSHAVASISHALSLVGASGGDVYLKKGDTFSSSTGWTVSHGNIVIQAYGSGNAPVLQQTSTTTSQTIAFAASINGVTIEDVNFDQTTGAHSFAVKVGSSGDSNISVRRSNFTTGVYTAFDGENSGSPAGVMLSDNTAAVVQGNFVYTWGTDIVILGNTSAGSQNEHNIRSYASQELVYKNILTNASTYNGDKSINTLRANNGSYIYWANNTVNSGVVYIGPLMPNDNGTDPTLNVSNLVMEDNIIYQRPWMYNSTTGLLDGVQNRIYVGAGTTHIMFRNNVIEAVNTQAFNVKSSDTQTWSDGIQRTFYATDIDLYNNTVVDVPLGDGITVGASTPRTQGVNGQFIQIWGTNANSVDLRNNLYEAPNIDVTDGFQEGGIDANTVTSPEGAVVKDSKDNVWSLPPNGTNTSYGVNYIASSTSPVTASSYRTPTEWASAFGTKVAGDAFVNITLDSTYTPTGANAASADIGVTAPGVFADMNGVARPGSAITDGAVQRLTVTIPAAPSSLTAATASSSQINLAWHDNSSNETGFKIDRATDSGFTQNLTTVTVAANSVSYNSTGLAASTTYYYRVRATNSAGDSANSNTANATTLATIPAAPSGLGVTVISNTQLNLGWTDNSNNETGFKIDRATNSSFTSNLVTVTVAANSTTYSSTGLTANTTYYYRVRATNSAGDSANTSTVSAATLNYGIFTSDTDIGAPSPAGSASDSAGTYTVKGGGADIWGTSDQFNYLSESFTGDGTLIAEVTSVADTNDFSQAGVIIRGDLTNGAAMAEAAIIGKGDALFRYRSTAGGTVTQTVIGGVPAPAWVEVVRTGSTFAGNYSLDGVTWTPIQAAVTLTMSTAAKAGLAVTSHDNGVSCTATFANVSLTEIATADAYVRDGTFATTNFGSDPSLVAKNSTTAGNNRQSFLTFNLADLATTSTANFELFGELTQADNLSISIYDVATTTWTESGITWNTKPTVGTTSEASVTLTSATGQWYNWNLTSYLQAEKAAGKTVISIAVVSDTSNTTAAAIFNSNQAGGDGPQLVIS